VGSPNVVDEPLELEEAALATPSLRMRSVRDAVTDVVLLLSTTTAKMVPASTAVVRTAKAAVADSVVATVEALPLLIDVAALSPIGVKRSVRSKSDVSTALATVSTTEHGAEVEKRGVAAIARDMLVKSVCCRSVVLNSTL
jgi:hypothetical protein